MSDQGIAEASDGRRTLLLEVSNEMVRLYKEQFGRGPTKARTDWAGPDVLVCTLKESFTPAERNLVALGQLQRLRDLRLFLQYASEDDFRNSVERITGRKVTAFVSGLDAKEDIATEVFYFDPES